MLNLKASSLLETLAALVITVTAFTLAFWIYSNVQSTNSPTQRLRAQHELTDFLASSEKHLTYGEYERKKDDYIYRYKLTPYFNIADAVHLHFTAHDSQGRTLYEENRLVRIAQ